ncbi:unnamed protein product [Caenorhabditis bovis]|uniref:Uncharacterized protein n=1 Tax=Caenorhabditis bovis TaxID=2654633 RepID=A0A8S1EEX6_9PELO|nr:unnamed protein product [Caenorhabditis bovis]
MLCLLLLSYVGYTYTSFCGNSAVPFSLEILPDGQPIANQCKLFQTCDKTFESGSCSSENQWVGGIVPLLNVSSSSTVYQCCTYEPLRIATDVGLATIGSGQFVHGGEVFKYGQQYAFDYIRNIEKKYDINLKVKYEVTLGRFPCLPPGDINETITEVIDAKNAIREFNDYEVRKAIAFDEPNVEVGPNEQIPINGAEIENAAPQPAVNEELVVQPAIQESVQPQETVVVEEIVAQSAPAPAPAPVQVAAPAYSGYSYFQPSQMLYCFTADSTVKTIAGEIKRMDELEVGEWIMGIGDTGIEFFPVTFWIHRVPDMFAQFRRIQLSDGSEIKLTDYHNIYKADCHNIGEQMKNSKILKKYSALAKDIQVGDCLYTTLFDTIKVAKVKRISAFNSTGIYSPMTSCGNIVVNDVYASCHTTVNNFAMQNSFFTLINEFNTLISSIFGISATRDLPMGLSIVAELLNLVVPGSLIF